MGGLGPGGPISAGWGEMLVAKKQSAQSHKPSDKGKQNHLLDAHPSERQRAGTRSESGHIEHVAFQILAVEASNVQQKPGPLLYLARVVTLLPRRMYSTLRVKDDDDKAQFLQRPAGTAGSVLFWFPTLPNATQQHPPPHPAFKDDVAKEGRAL